MVLERETLGERVADGVARFGGSWYFIFAFGLVLCVWVLLNTKLVLLRRPNGEPFDPYPFILLNLFLSMLAAIQAPVIMMSQNRQDKRTASAPSSTSTSTSRPTGNHAAAMRR